MRSLGKMAKYGHLSGPERERLKSCCQGIMGIDEKGEWDRAFIVRKEAEEAMQYV
jgi:hypothetical protein